MDENDPVAFTLLEIGRRNQHAQPESGKTEDDRDGDKIGDQRASQRIEHGG